MTGPDRPIPYFYLNIISLDNSFVEFGQTHCPLINFLGSNWNLSTTGYSPGIYRKKIIKY